MKVLPKYIDIICPSCSKQARYDFPTHTFLKRGDTFISGYIQLEGKLQTILANQADTINQYTVHFEFGGCKTTKISLREFLEIRTNPTKRHRFEDVRKIGWVSCLTCGFSKSISFHQDLYYYKITIGNRYLVARTRENFLSIKRAFEQDLHSNHDPDLDYPKLFWQKKDLIVEKMNKLLQT